MTFRFHRFFFLADFELITVLGGSIKDPKVQALIKKLFVNVSSIVPDDLGIIDVLYTTDGEDLPLCKSVNTKINTIEGWLAEMLEETKVALGRFWKSKNLVDLAQVSTKLLLRLARQEVLCICTFMFGLVHVLLHFESTSDLMFYKKTSPKIGPSRCARFVFVFVCNIL